MDGTGSAGTVNTSAELVMSSRVVQGVTSAYRIRTVQAASLDIPEGTVMKVRSFWVSINMPHFPQFICLRLTGLGL